MSALDGVLTLDSWITSDNHWEHPKIREYQDRPEDHFELMRAEWIRLVQPDDVLLHLGDIACFGDRSLHKLWIEGLPGRKFLIRGNHDRHSNNWYEEAGFTVLGRGNVFWHRPDTGASICFSHEPETYIGGWSINVHGHKHGNAPFVSGRRRNVSVERTNYRPMRLREVLDARA